MGVARLFSLGVAKADRVCILPPGKNYKETSKLDNRQTNRQTPGITQPP